MIKTKKIVGLDIKEYRIGFRPFIKFERMIRRWFSRRAGVSRNFMDRRPHRSLRRTRKRDYARSLRLPGYIAFSRHVWQVIWDNRKLFLKFLLLYAILSIVIMGALNQDAYVTLRNGLNEVSTELDLDRVFTLFTTAVTDSSGQDATFAGQLTAGLFLLLGWLTTVWILRQRLVGDEIRLRDALYNAGAPILSTLMLLLFAIVQLLPLTLVLLAYTVITGAGVINLSIDIENMAAFLAVVVMAVMTLYWLTTTLIALVMVTKQGIYPFQALRMAGDIVVGRRLRVMYRLLFMVIPVIVLWVLVLAPIIILDNAIQIDWLPLVQIFTLILSTVTLIWVASYIYILYRFIIEDDSPPVINFDKKEKKRGLFGRKNKRIS